MNSCDHETRTPTQESTATPRPTAGAKGRPDSAVRRHCPTPDECGGRRNDGLDNTTDHKDGLRLGARTRRGALGMWSTILYR